jgi:prepilin-type N-terminal cleavage/methylation domain-containing protein
MGGIKNFLTKKRDDEYGFTIVEIVIVLLLIGILATITYSIAVPKWRERTYYSKAVSETSAIAAAARLYVAQYNTWPPDVHRGVPAALEQFMQSNGINGQWSKGPWPGSYYDWDNWAPNSQYGNTQTVQVSIRFCQPDDTATCQKNFPKESWVTSAWDSYSAVYYCISGDCRSHEVFPASHPGYCINCAQNKSDFY